MQAPGVHRELSLQLSCAMADVSYVITSYEQSVFAVYQSKFPDLDSPETAEISSASTGNHVSGVTRTIRVALSLGIVAFFSLTLIAVIVAVRKKRKEKKRNHRDGEGDHDIMNATDLRQHPAQKSP